MAKSEPAVAEISDQGPATRKVPATVKGRMRRDKIRTVTATLLESHSYYDITLEQITRAAGIPTSVFYHYYESKRELVLELLDDLFFDFRHSVTSAGPFGTFENGLVLMNARILHLYRDHLGLMRCVTQVEELAFATRWRDHMNRWRRGLGAAMMEFTSSDGDVNELVAIAHAMSGMTESFAHEYYVHKNADLRRRFPEIDAAARFLTVLWVRAVFAANPQSLDAAEFPTLFDLRDASTP